MKADPNKQYVIAYDGMIKQTDSQYEALRLLREKGALAALYIRLEDAANVNADSLARIAQLQHELAGCRFALQDAVRQLAKDAEDRASRTLARQQHSTLICARCYTFGEVPNCEYCASIDTE